MPESVANSAQTTLAAPLAAGGTAVTVASAAGFPAAPFRIRVGSEILVVTATAGSWAVARAQEGTAAAAYPAGELVTQVLTAAGLGGLASAYARGLAGGRLTLESGTPVSSTDQVGKSTLYYVPLAHGLVGLYSAGAGWREADIGTGISLALTGLTTDFCYDVFAYAAGGAPALEVAAWGQAATNATNASPIVVTANGHGLANGDTVVVTGVGGNTAANNTAANPLWTIAGVTANTFQLAGSAGSGAYTSGGWVTARTTGSALARQDGVLVKSGDPTRRYLGTLRATGATTTEDSAARRFVWNYYNRVLRPLQAVDTTDTWTYTTQTWRQARGVAANKVEYVVGVPLDAVSAVAQCSAVINGTATLVVAVGVGANSTSANAAATTGAALNANAYGRCEARYAGVPRAGYQYLAWLEISQAAGSTLWHGDGGTTGLQSGLTAEVWG